jgi:hypothetical protein
MRASLLFLCLSFYLPINIQAQTKPELPKFEGMISTNPAFAMLISEHADKEAVASLKRDLASGTIQAALDKDANNFLVGMWEKMLIRTIVGWFDTKTLLLPTDFFKLNTCKRNMAIEALGLVYHHLISLGGNQAEILSRFSSSGDDIEVNDNEEKELSAILDGFEKLATDNTDQFAKITFASCQPTEMKNIFFNYGTAVYDEKKWSAQTKKNIAEQFKEFRIMLQNK